RRWLVAVPLSVLAGSVTHLAWDSFTHPEAPAGAAFPFLRVRLWTVSDYPVCVFNVLPHASTPLGIVLLVRSGLRWGARSAPRPGRPGISPRARAAIVCAIVAVATVAALVVARGFLPGYVTLETIQPCVWHLATTELGTIGAGIVLYSLAWHLRGRRVATA